MGERQQEKIPFANAQASGLEALGGASPVAHNVVIDATGTVSRRPGIIPWCPVTVNANGVTGIYETVDGTVYAIGGTVPSRHIYKVSTAGKVDLSMIPEGDLRGSLRPKFAETASILAIAGGQEVEKVVLASQTPSRLANTPPGVFSSHVIANHSRLLINDVTLDKDVVYYSETAGGSSYAGFEIWTAPTTPVLSSAGFFSAEARPDPIVALHENGNEVFAFGTSSVQVFGPQETSGFPFAPVAALDFGCGAPDSIVKVDTQFGWLDSLRRFVVSDGRSQTVISDPIQQTLQSLLVVSDCFGYRVTMGNLDTFVWTFPTDGRTFTYQKGAGWGEWSAWDGNWGRFTGTASAKLRSTGQVLVATNGTIGELYAGATTDLGEAINAYVVTGFQDRGTDNRKTCKKVRLSLRRGQNTGITAAPVALLSWRDNLGAWEPPLKVSLGTTGESDPVIEFWSLGVYRRRQWKLEFAGTEAYSLVSATEEFTVESN